MANSTEGILTQPFTVDQTQFNQMRKPRQVTVKLRILLLFLVINAVVIAPATLAFYANYKSESFNLALAQSGVQVPGKILEVHRERRGKKAMMVATYEYQYLGQIYRCRGTETHRWPSAGAAIVVYVSPDDPQVRRADFEVGTEEDLHKTWKIMGLFALFTIGLSFAIDYIAIFRPRQILSMGTMETATILSLRRGKGAGAEVEYHVNGIRLTAKVQFTPKNEQIGDQVQVVYDPAKPSSAVKFPHMFCDVGGIGRRL